MGAIGLALTIAGSYLVDRIALPHGPLRRSVHGAILHSVAVAWLVSLVLLVTARPIFSSVTAIALTGLLVIVSNAKYESLREPFVFTDLSLFSQLFAHPRLYLPFLSVGKVAAIVAGATIVVVGYLAEPPITPRPVPEALAIVALAFLLGRYLASRMLLTLEPGQDQIVHGFFSMFVAYMLNGLRAGTFRVIEDAAQTGPFAASMPVRRPDVILIQSESFFDVRRISPEINLSVLKAFDRAKRESVFFGQLTVPAWGANTMRTEFAVLTGLPSKSLGYARFYPYAFVRSACASIARWFGRGGYGTLAIHPYHATFFGRERAFQRLGFDRFLDIDHFTGAPYAGQYIADSSVLDTIIDVQGGEESPCFVFAVTMENHGPLHLEQVLPGESSSRHTLGEDPSWRDLTAYLRHIENADAMIGRLLDHLRASDRETVVCFYGDHVPALPHVFEKLGVTPQTSDYFIWRNYGTDTTECRNLAAEELGVALLHVVQDDGNRVEQPCASEKAT
ncbi:LTA synthase family protein [Burkholderia cenocepacia]|uniref:LTA synthase family protein n=1 Tax=Burkholderia cenocepacia TaxID=95486 RepID=UPI002ABE2E36|nr:LTA synthase family protein [Burkholderia cenocepacia]